MRSHQQRARLFRAVTLSLLAGASAVPLLLAQNAWAGQRQFLVTLANPPKQFACVGGASDGRPCHPTVPTSCAGGVCTTVRTLPNKQQIENVYFNNPDSFAAFWREISYGEVTISGRVTDWLQLPWPIRPAGPNVLGTSIPFIDMDADGEYQYGKGEKFDNQKAMVRVDVDGDPVRLNDGPFTVNDNPVYARGARNTASNGTPVWTPGERFLDMDNDGKWDGLDEARNSMDWRGRTDPDGNPIGDGRPDLKGPWYDLNADNIPLNAANCTYLPDSDNDGNPDCCPNGPGLPGCEGIGPRGDLSEACPPSTWTGPPQGTNQTNTITDCNGNLIPDACDISATSPACIATGFQCSPGVCGNSKDRLPVSSGAANCGPFIVNGIPDECEFESPDNDCVLVTPPNGDPCPTTDTCTRLTGNDVRTTVPRCEYDDSNRSTTLDIVEPFENGIARGKIANLADPQEPDFCKDIISEDYIRANFPGGIADSVIARGKTRTIYGAHDPNGKLTTCTCPPGRDPDPLNPGCQDVLVTLPDNSQVTIAGACIAGEHAQYDPPDSWTDRGPGPKMRIDKKLLERYTTPEPPWYQQAWRDRYGTDPPPWTNPTLAAVPVPSTGVTARREFIANRGGLHGDGTGWIGCAANNPQTDQQVVFATGLCAEVFGFETVPTCNHRILPEETAGIGATLLTFDGGVEFDDLPSSKYHRGGDEALGEVTSPFNTDIWGQDRGPSDGGFGGPDFIIPAAGPYATKLHGQLGRDAGNVLQMEILTWRRGKVCADGFNVGELCNANSDCPRARCQSGRCVGVTCNADSDCPPTLHCQSGQCVGDTCLADVDCPTSTCKEYINNGAAWEALHGPHPYAGPSGLNLGFRDYNLDGLIDLGESVVRGSENYMLDPNGKAPFGTSTDYPWNRRRLMEDCIAVLDDVIDFDDFVDPVAMDAVTCGAGQSVSPPVPFGGSTFPASGFLSGVVILPHGTKVDLEAEHDPFYYPIHNEDGLFEAGVCQNGRCIRGLPPIPNTCTTNADCPPNALYASANFPGPPYTPERKAQLNWSLSFHDLLQVLEATGGGGITSQAAQAPQVAHVYGETWEHFPPMWDFDRDDNPDAENCPVGNWDLAADGGLVHPAPVLKELSPPVGCTQWVKPVDLTTVLTPGVDKALTLPVAEFVRDDSYFYIENEDRLGERYWFWSAGEGFDKPRPGGGMPGKGVLIMHTDVGSNPDALPPQQRSGDRPTYLIVQADGRSQLQACENKGDAGDPWPGTSNRRTFDCNTLPASEWYTDNACTGLEVLDIALDGSGSALVTFNWTPTSIPSLKFIDPPGGVSVGTPPIYNIRTEATDVFGGTWVRFFYTLLDTQTPDPAAVTSKPINPPNNPPIRKTTPGTGNLSTNWNIAGIADGHYFLFADLIPDQGADGRERKLTSVRAGRNNVGTASLVEGDVTVDTSTIVGGVVNHTGTARTETWTIRCVDATAGKWVVGSSLTQPLPPGEPSASTCGAQLPATCANRGRCATTGTPYKSCGSEVEFTIAAGLTGSFKKGALGDTFTFTTTGITAPSAAVTIRNGQIREDPTAVIDASPLSGPPPLKVDFDARGSTDPNGQPLTFGWKFGDGATGTGAQVSHTYSVGGSFTVTLKATNPANTRFGEDSVDIQVTNNSPKAVIKATPTSGGAQCGANPDGRCLTVHFSAAQSSDAETGVDQLIYQWNYGDGVTANDAKVAGILREPEHTYSRQANGTLCTRTSPCTFTATLTVTDGGGKSDTNTVDIRVGNANPVANISTTALSGSSPWTVTFNAKNSTDPDKTCNGIGPVCTQNTDCPSGQVCQSDPLEVEWAWDDGSPNEKYPAKTGKTPPGDGSVPHTFTLPAGTTSKTFAVKATVYDLKADGTRKGGVAQAGMNVTVTTAVPGDSDPRAIFCFQTPTDCVATSPTLAVDQSFKVDASRSFDNPPGGRISAYTWDWGDGTPFASGVTQTHKYSAAGTYTIKLTVADGDSPPHTNRTQKSVVVTPEGGPPPTPSTNHPPTAIFPQPPDAFVNEVVNFDAGKSSDPDVGDVLHYRWVFGDGHQTEFTTNPLTTHTYASPGSYLVRLTVRDTANASTDATQTVRVLLPGENRSPVAMIATGPRTGSAPLTLKFDGSLSFDPDGGAITFAWEFGQNGALIDPIQTGSVVTQVFETPGEYTVELVVKDVDNLEGRSGTERILVAEPSEPPTTEPPTTRPEPQEPPASAAQRPVTGTCGIGMLMSMFGSLLGLTLTVVTRRPRERSGRAWRGSR